MLTHFRRVFQWFSGLVKLSPEEMREADVYMGRRGEPGDEGQATE